MKKKVMLIVAAVAVAVIIAALLLIPRTIPGSYYGHGGQGDPVHRKIFATPALVVCQCECVEERK